MTPPPNLARALEAAYKTIAECPYREDEATYRGFVLVTLEKAMRAAAEPEAPSDDVLRVDLGYVPKMNHDEGQCGACRRVFCRSALIGGFCHDCTTRTF